MERTPKNIFEQILYGLEATNTNVVDLSQEIIILRQDLQAIKDALYMNNSEPNALGAEENGTVESNNF